MAVTATAATVATPVLWGLTAAELADLGIAGASLGGVLYHGYGALTDYWARNEEAKDREYRRKMDAKQDNWNYWTGMAKDIVGGVKLVKDTFGKKKNGEAYNNQILETPKSYEQLRVVQAQRYPWAYRATLPSNLPPYVPKDNQLLQDILKYKQLQNSQDNKNKPPTDKAFKPSAGTRKIVSTTTRPNGTVTRREEIIEPNEKPKTATANNKQTAASTTVREEAVKEEPSLNSPIKTINDQVQEAEEKKKEQDSSTNSGEQLISAPVDDIALGKELGKQYGPPPTKPFAEPFKTTTTTTITGNTDPAPPLRRMRGMTREQKVAYLQGELDASNARLDRYSKAFVAADREDRELHTQGVPETDPRRQALDKQRSDARYKHNLCYEHLKNVEKKKNALRTPQEKAEAREREKMWKEELNQRVREDHAREVEGKEIERRLLELDRQLNWDDAQANRLTEEEQAEMNDYLQARRSHQLRDPPPPDRPVNKAGAQALLARHNRRREKTKQQFSPPAAAYEQLAEALNPRFAAPPPAAPAGSFEVSLRKHHSPPPAPIVDPDAEALARLGEPRSIDDQVVALVEKAQRVKPKQKLIVLDANPKFSPYARAVAKNLQSARVAAHKRRLARKQRVNREAA